MSKGLLPKGMGIARIQKRLGRVILPCTVGNFISSEDLFLGRWRLLPLRYVRYGRFWLGERAREQADISTQDPLGGGGGEAIWRAGPSLTRHWSRETKSVLGAATSLV